MLTWPLTRTIVPAAAFLGLLAAGAVIAGHGVLRDPSIRSAADVEQHLGLPVLGSIPLYRGARQTRRQLRLPTSGRAHRRRNTCR